MKFQTELHCGIMGYLDAEVVYTGPKSDPEISQILINFNSKDVNVIEKIHDEDLDEIKREIINFDPKDEDYYYEQDKDLS